MDNLRGAALMVAAMAAFAVEDALIKALSATYSAGGIVATLGAGGTLAFAVWLAASGQSLSSPAYTHPRVLVRTAAEAVGTVFFVSALTLVPLALASAILQATPLVVALGAALFLGAEIGWRRWIAILAGFAGVLVILRPGLAGFDPAALLAVAGMLCLATRDLVTRGLPAGFGGAHLSLAAFASLVPAGLVLMAIEGASWPVPGPREAALFAACVAVGMLAYLLIVAATRAGDIALVSSFRYSRMVFALSIGVLVFGEIPDGATLIGAGIIIGSGLYTLARERQARRRARAAGTSGG